MIAVAAVVVFLVNIWNTLVETRLIWLVPVIIIGVVIYKVYENKKAEEEKEQERIRIEQERVEGILSRQSEWGKEMCNWLINNEFNLQDARVAGIMQKLDEFGVETCQNLLQQKTSIGYTDEMVRLSLGEPTSIDNTEITEKWEKFRWIYGVPRRGAVYLWLRTERLQR
jgi:hypothetical protein